MVVEDLLQFLPPVLAFGLVYVGMRFREPMTGIFGGVLFFFYGIMILMNPLPALASTMNTVVGSLSFGYGFYIWFVGAFEQYGPILNNIQN